MGLIKYRHSLEGHLQKDQNEFQIQNLSKKINQNIPLVSTCLGC